MYTKLTIPSALPWKNEQLYALTIPVQNGEFMVENRPRKTYDFTHIHGNVWSIENRTDSILCVADLEQNPMDVLFEESKTVWFKLPPRTTYVTVNLQPHKIKTPYKLILYPESNATTAKLSEIVINMIPTVIHSGEYDCHEFIVGDASYRNVFGDLSNGPPDTVLKFLMNQLYSSSETSQD